MSTVSSAFMSMVSYELCLFVKLAERKEFFDESRYIVMEKLVILRLIWFVSVFRHFTLLRNFNSM